MKERKAAVIFERGPHRGLRRSEVVRRIDAMVELLQLQKNEISFVLTDDKSIHRLNKLYRHIDRPTDVLAFALREGELAALAGEALGDVIVSVETARKQAGERGADLLDEVTMLLAHGLLHLLGWDHDTPARDRRMRAETDRLCAAARPATPAPDGRTADRPRSKPRARAALSRKPARVTPGQQGRKVQAHRRVKRRR